MYLPSSSQYWEEHSTSNASTGPGVGGDSLQYPANIVLRTSTSEHIPQPCNTLSDDTSLDNDNTNEVH